MKRKSTAPSGRAIYPSRLMPRPSTTFRMDDVVDGHLILSQDKSSRWATGEQTPQHRRRKDTSTNANSPSSYPLSLRINAWNQTAKLLARNISATTTRTAALARNDPL